MFYRQWIFQVPLKGGIGGIVHPPIGSIYHLYTTYSPCLLGGYIIPTTLYRNLKNPLKFDPLAVKIFLRRHDNWKMNTSDWSEFAMFFPIFVDDNLELGGGFKYFLFLPLFGEDFQFDDHIFQLGWLNHQLVEVVWRIFWAYNKRI